VGKGKGEIDKKKERESENVKSYQGSLCRKFERMKSYQVKCDEIKRRGNKRT
jgi:hypothetical protein